MTLKLGFLFYQNLILGVDVRKSVFLLCLCFLGNFLAEEIRHPRLPNRCLQTRFGLSEKQDILGLIDLQRNINRINRETLSNNSDM